MPSDDINNFTKSSVAASVENLANSTKESNNVNINRSEHSDYRNFVALLNILRNTCRFGVVVNMSMTEFEKEPC